MFKRYILFLLLVISQHRLYAQVGDTLIQNESDKAKGEKVKKIKFQFQLDLRNSFIRNAPIDVYGINTGIKYKERYRFGVGFYIIANTFANNFQLDSSGRNVPVNNGKPGELTYFYAQRELQIYYATLNFAYSFINNKYIEISVPLEIGFGHYHANYNNVSINPALTENQRIEAQRIIDHGLFEKRKTNGTFIPVLAGIAFTAKLHKWIYPQFSIGYRKTLEETDFKANFDGMYWHVGAQINLSRIYHDYKRWRKKFKG